jgi:hypothetical protein
MIILNVTVFSHLAEVLFLLLQSIALPVTSTDCTVLD